MNRTVGIILSAAAVFFLAATTSTNPAMSADNSDRRQVAAVTIPSIGSPSVTNVRIGVHPDKTRIVLDVTAPIDFNLQTASGGDGIMVDLPSVGWLAPRFTARHARGLIADLSFNGSAERGGRLNVFSTQPVRVTRPLLLGPSGRHGHRVVIDLYPAAGLDRNGGFVTAGRSNALRQPVAASAAVMRRPVMQQPAPRRAAPRQPSEWQGGFETASNYRGVSQPRTQSAQMQPGPHGQQAPASTFPGSGAPRQNFFGIEGLYSRGGGGASFTTRSDNEGTGNLNNFEYDTGYAIYGAVGIDLNNSFRIEVEGSYSSNSLKSISGIANSTGFTTGNIEGDVSSLSFMSNVAYDMVNETRLTPFIFGGAGLAGIFANGITAGGVAIADDIDWVFALQGGAGVSFDINERMSLEALYKYFETTDPEFADGNGNPFTSEYASHSLLFGARYKF